MEEIGKIIQRDYFPDLPLLRAQNDYLDAQCRGDAVKLQELYGRYCKTPSIVGAAESPATFETPQMHSEEGPISARSHKSAVSMCSSGSKASSTGGISNGHSLDSFLDSYTSEDNKSFHEIMEKADRKLKQKFSVLYEAEATTAIEMSKSLALPSIETQFEAIEGPRKLDMWTYKNKNYIMYVPDGVELTKEEQLEMAKNRQEVVHSNTRLSHQPWSDPQSKAAASGPAKNALMMGKVNMDGNTIETSNTPQVRGFRFERTPSPCPGVAESPIMTWGEIEGTPFRLDGGDTPMRNVSGPSFRINERSRRESIGMELAEKAAERMRGQKAKAMEAARRNIGAASPHIRSSMDRLASMSPAAQRLVTGSATTLRTGSRNSDLVRHRGSGTPHRRTTTPSPVIVKRLATPSTNILTPDGRSGADLTRNLLNIPSAGKRNKASDFF